MKYLKIFENFDSTAFKKMNENKSFDKAFTQRNFPELSDLSDYLIQILDALGVKHESRNVGDMKEILLSIDIDIGKKESYEQIQGGYYHGEYYITYCYITGLFADNIDFNFEERDEYSEEQIKSGKDLVEIIQKRSRQDFSDIFKDINN